LTLPAELFVCERADGDEARDEVKTDRAFIETARTDEPIGSDVNFLENKTRASVTRTMRVSREWTRQIALSVMEESSTSTEAKITPRAVAITSQVKESVQKSCQITIGEVQKVDEELKIDIPPNTSLKVTVSWKRIWQNGYLEPGLGYGETPLRLCVGLTFDFQRRKSRRDDRSALARMPQYRHSGATDN
jgi:hypothetical protein